MKLSSYKEIVLCNRVKELRLQNDYSQDELAQLVGTSRNTICAIEIGKFFPTIKLAIALSDVLEEDIDYLFYNGDKGKWSHDHYEGIKELRQRKIDMKHSK